MQKRMIIIHVIALASTSGCRTAYWYTDYIEPANGSMANLIIQNESADLVTTALSQNPRDCHELSRLPITNRGQRSHIKIRVGNKIALYFILPHKILSTDTPVS